MSDSPWERLDHSARTVQDITGYRARRGELERELNKEEGGKEGARGRDEVCLQPLGSTFADNIYQRQENPTKQINSNVSLSQTSYFRFFSTNVFNRIQYP